MATAMFLLAIMAAPMSAAPSKIQLSAASVSPRTGTPRTTIVITVMFQSGKGGRAGQMTAAIGGTDHTMTRVPGGTWETGVKFRWAGTLALGTYPVVLRALARGSAIASIGAGTITIKRPPPPAPAQTPKPKPKPSAAPRTPTRPTPTKPVAILTVARPAPGPVVPSTSVETSERRNDSFIPPFLIAGGTGGPTDPTGGGPGGSGLSVPVNPEGRIGGGGGDSK